MIPKNITREHVLAAIKKIRKDGVPKGRNSRKYVLIFKEELFPPKYLISLANKYPNGKQLSPEVFSGGEETNSYLRHLGFEIRRKSAKRTARPTTGISPTKKVTIKRKHDERCPQCKVAVAETLRAIYGEVEVEFKFNMGVRPQDFSGKVYQGLLSIFNALTDHRGHGDFIKTNNLPHVDFYVPNPGFIVEYDESQHFTMARRASLQHYPSDMKSGYSNRRWTDLCERINAQDRSPIYRDEQRAWYDTLRDFVPMIIGGMEPTIRIYADDYVWCSLNPDDKNDHEIFRSFLYTPTLKIGRTILNLDKSRKEIYDGNPWENHKQDVIDLFRYQKQGYQRRIRELINAAGDHGCDIVLLPACTLVYSTQHELKQFINPDLYIATGALDLSGVEPKEIAVIIENGEVVGSFDNSYVSTFNHQGRPFYIAISSTITNLSKGGPIQEFENRDYREKRSFALDLGHHQYSGRYIRSLRAVLNRIISKHGGNHAVILSFWRYKNGNTRSPWYQSNYELEARRILLGDDILDIIEI